MNPESDINHLVMRCKPARYTHGGGARTIWKLAKLAARHIDVDNITEGRSFFDSWWAHWEEQSRAIDPANPDFESCGDLLSLLPGVDDRDDARGRFNYALRRRWQGHTGWLEDTIEFAETSPPPPEAQIYINPGHKLLVAVCRELQRRADVNPDPRSPGAPHRPAFYLVTRTAAEIIDAYARDGGPDGKAGWRALQLLVDDGVLEIARQGKPRTKGNKGEETWYRYIGSNVSTSQLDEW